jgi:hypothetical protein
MKKISLILAVFFMFCVTEASAVLRASARAGAEVQSRAALPGISARTATVESRPATGESRPATSEARTAVKEARAATGGIRGGALAGVRSQIEGVAPAVKGGAGVSVRAGNLGNSSVVPRSLQPLTQSAVRSPVSARAAAETPSIAGTKTGAEYEHCKSAYFACMDQFCTVKNASYQRCSCSDRIYDITSAQNVMQDANEELAKFTESLDVVGMTAAQAASMRNASEGELALTGDKSASKALLQAIMNSIKGENASVGGIYEGLNSINIRMDDSAGFGLIDSGQAIAAYNGKNLYAAIYGKCREAVRGDCNDASLQRSVTAYLMAMEQDCNTIQKQLDDTKKKMSSAVREGGAMLDLARVKNRQERNSSDATECLRNVESAVLSEEVCGSGYRKCLDNGKYIDIATGKPMEGVIEFYKLQEMLSFSKDILLSDQNLAKIPANKQFVSDFEKKVKQFAQPALDKCQEIAESVWTDYLDKAMLEIYYAQREKVETIKTGCMDFVSSCYVNESKAVTSAMVDIINGSVSLVPQTVELLDSMCKKYVAACDNMFGEPDGDGIIAQYIEARKEQDLTDSCRAVVKQCFDSFGGTNYSNFYRLGSGLFSRGAALKWFTFQNHDNRGEISPCAKRLEEVSACKNANPENSNDFTKKVFGGFDAAANNNNETKYGILSDADTNAIDEKNMHKTGVATEIYNQIVNYLEYDCRNKNGRFMNIRFLDKSLYGYVATGSVPNYCTSKFNQGRYQDLVNDYKIGTGTTTTTTTGNTTTTTTTYDGVENMCPRGYSDEVDIDSWGTCNCWENGGHRSNNGIDLSCSPGSSRTTISIYVTGSKNKGKVCPDAGCNSTGHYIDCCPGGIDDCNDAACKIVRVPLAL